MTGTTWIAGPLFASLAAGPLFTLALAITVVALTPTNNGSALVGFGIIFALSVPVGFVAALLPTIAGSALLAWSGAVWRPARHPLVWAVTGGVLGWLIGAAVVGSLMAVPMVATGTACALLCRMGVAWGDGMSYSDRL